MSIKMKFPSSTSTPVKTNLFENSSLSASPAKGGKYKSLLTAILTPSQTKKWLRRKKSNKSLGSFKGAKAESEAAEKVSQISDDFCDPAYSSIEELQLNRTQQEKVIDSQSVPGTTDFTDTDKTSNRDLFQPEQSNLNSGKEPIYSTVNKQKKLKNVNTAAGLTDDNTYKKSGSESVLCDETKTEYDDSSYKKLVEEQQEEIKLLVERMKELTKENIELHKTIETVIRESKWKDDSRHAELKLEITQLESKTREEVKCLSDQLKSLHKERLVLTEQVQVLHEENKMLKSKYEDAFVQMRSMISPEFMKKIVDEHEMSLKQIKKHHIEEMKKLQLENEELLESKIELMGESEALKEKLQLLNAKNETLKKSEQELLLEKNRISLQLDESKQMQQEAENMLLSLLKIAETILIERDVLLNKSSFQDHQRKLLQSTMMDYSLNMGRLQEHISNFSKEKLDELQKLKAGESFRDENMKSFYGKQLDLLRSKILSQSNTIYDLESEKSKLEQQLESLWKVTSIEKPKS